MNFRGRRIGRRLQSERLSAHRCRSLRTWCRSRRCADSTCKSAAEGNSWSSTSCPRRHLGPTSYCLVAPLVAWLPWSSNGRTGSQERRFRRARVSRASGAWRGASFFRPGEGIRQLLPPIPRRHAARLCARLVGQSWAKVRVALDVEAEIPRGIGEQLIRTITENARSLKFTNQEFKDA